MIKAARLKTHKNQKPAQPINKPASNQSTTTQKELGGPKGKEPTRYGDWEKNGRCIDF